MPETSGHAKLMHETQAQVHNEIYLEIGTKK